MDEIVHTKTVNCFS